MNIFATFDPKVRQGLLILFTAGLLFWSSLASLLPTMPLYVQHLGGNKQQIGLVMGAFAIGLLASRAQLGRMADQRGRKLVLLLGMGAVAIAPIGYLFVDSIPLLMVIRAFHGISIAAFPTAYSALVVDLSPENHRGEVIGYMSLVTPIGVAIGPALGGFLQAWAGYAPLFLIAAGLGLLGLGCTSQIQEASQVNGLKLPTAPDSQAFWSLLRTDRLRIPALVLLLIGLAFGALSTFVPLFIQETGVNLNAGLFYTAAAIASFVMRLVVGRASDRYGRGLFISISLVFYTGAMLLLWSAHSATNFLMAGAIEGTGAGILIPMMATLMADRAYPHERGRLFGLCMAGFDLGIAVAGPSLGFVAEQLGYRTIFGLSAGLAFVALLIFLTQSSKNLPSSLRFALGLGGDVYALPKGLEH
ncbi:MAG: MFS transporter [Leptolyngbyaceae bacterium]|nr:MFS transporter [Leptolyngbyaceae bacterium]